MVKLNFPSSLKEITLERYDDLLGCVPPIYIKAIDGQPVEIAFAVSEAYSHNDNGVVLTVCYQDDGKFYQVLANVHKFGAYVQDTYAHQFGRGYLAETTEKTRYHV